tara:strand:- start:111 stop:434 length:324 start_codon:yes stop_codon:yes gene_type:complete
MRCTRFDPLTHNSMNNTESTAYRLVERIKIFFGIGQDLALVTLLNAARSDVNILEKLLAVLSQPSFQRQSLLGLWREEIRLKGAHVASSRRSAHCWMTVLRRRQGTF